MYGWFPNAISLIHHPVITCCDTGPVEGKQLPKRTLCVHQFWQYKMTSSMLRLVLMLVVLHGSRGDTSVVHFDSETTKIVLNTSLHSDIETSTENYDYYYSTEITVDIQECKLSRKGS